LFGQEQMRVLQRCDKGVGSRGVILHLL